MYIITVDTKLARDCLSVLVDLVRVRTVSFSVESCSTHDKVFEWSCGYGVCIDRAVCMPIGTCV